MIIKFESITNKALKRVIGHSIYLVILFVFIPGFFYFEVCIVLPAIVKDESIQLIHKCASLFLLLNVVGNMIYAMLTDSCVQGKRISNRSNEEWTTCVECECVRPPRAWHCDICNVCILKRDHHCTYITSCIGYYNYRYFIFFTLYVFISMMYAFFYNVQFVGRFLSWSHGLAFFKFFFPLAYLVIDFGVESLYIFMFVVNLIAGCFSGFLCFYHFDNILKGQTTPERHHMSTAYDKGWKANIVEVFGCRWYLTWILPFIQSPLPGDGTYWDSRVKDK